MPENTADAMRKILDTLGNEGGTFVLSSDVNHVQDRWTAALEFGIGGSAYGSGDSSLEAVANLSKDLH